jgi:hypothetical protein
MFNSLVERQKSRYQFATNYFFNKLQQSDYDCVQYWFKSTIIYFFCIINQRILQDIYVKITNEYKINIIMNDQEEESIEG